ncbi:hypothetical protein CLOM_g16682 [Closterium sp. NIES-68]|nr:hypothetical protein CLOM_g16682 [Closterium sp. NIES-68]GJP82802.1 hypothetical protein CLOP_g13031 [Closterium sp. NIES-67]
MATEEASRNVGAANAAVDTITSAVVDPRQRDSRTNLLDCNGSTGGANSGGNAVDDELHRHGAAYNESARVEGGRDGAAVFRVVIVGAGPAGLVLANHLLTRGGGRFHVSVVEKGEDPREKVEEAVEVARRYSIGLNVRAFRCLDAVPGLLKTVLACMVPIRQLCIGMTSKPSVIPFSHKDPPVLLADRTALCCALLQALLGEGAQGGDQGGERRGERGGDQDEGEGECEGKRPVKDGRERRGEIGGRVGEESQEGEEHSGGSSRESLDLYFNTRCEGINIKKHTVTLQPAECSASASLKQADSEQPAALGGAAAGAAEALAAVGNNQTRGRGAVTASCHACQQKQQPVTLGYDLLVGADGVCSTVRSTLVTRTRDFAIESLPIFGEWAVASIPAPASLPPYSMILVPRVPRTPGISVVGLPAQGGNLCLLWAWSALARPSDWLALRSNAEATEETKEAGGEGRRRGEMVPREGGMEGGKTAGGEGNADKTVEPEGMAQGLNGTSSKRRGHEARERALGGAEQEQGEGAERRSRALAYIEERVPWLGMTAEGAETLLNQQPRTSMRVKCWQYHESAARIALIGDSAHATCPSLGQGCNAAITDASVLARLLLGEVVSRDTLIPPHTEESTWKLLQGVQSREGSGRVELHREVKCGANGCSVRSRLRSSLHMLFRTSSRLTTGVGGRVAPEAPADSVEAERGGDASWGGVGASPQHLRKHLAGLLARYSALQVPEGHALVDLSDAGAPISNLYSWT